MDVNIGKLSFAQHSQKPLYQLYLLAGPGSILPTSDTQAPAFLLPWVANHQPVGIVATDHEADHKCMEHAKREYSNDIAITRTVLQISSDMHQAGILQGARGASSPGSSWCVNILQNSSLVQVRTDLQYVQTWVLTDLQIVPVIIKEGGRLPELWPDCWWPLILAREQVQPVSKSGTPLELLLHDTILECNVKVLAENW